MFQKNPDIDERLGTKDSETTTLANQENDITKTAEMTAEIKKAPRGKARSLRRSDPAQDTKPSRQTRNKRSLQRSGPAQNTKPSPRTRKKVPYAHVTLGFGVPATTDPHHFIVHIPRLKSTKNKKREEDPILVSEHLGMTTESSEHVIYRVRLDRTRWDTVQETIKHVFNARLREHNLAICEWKVGDNPVDRLLGKELCTLLWAVERMSHEKMGDALRYWVSLRPEERWWLFGVTAMTAGKVGDTDKGWRMALRYAMGDSRRSSEANDRKVTPRSSDKSTHSTTLFDD
jgi:hypothetical protein